MGKPDLGSLLARAQDSRNKVRCVTCRLVAELSPDDSMALRAALDDPEMSAPMIAEALRAYGVQVSTTAIGRHRRECR